MMSAEDIYDSRRLEKPEIIPRDDPVVYSKEKKLLPINQEKFDSYERDGYMVIDQYFSGPEVQILFNEANRLHDISESSTIIPVIRERSSNKIRSIFQPHLLSPIFSSVFYDPMFIELAKYILDDDVYIHQSRINFKPPFNGKEFYWHSDFETWHMEDGMPRMRALSLSITLTENYEFNGPLLVIPGSHKKYVRCKGLTPKNHFHMSLVKQDYGIPDESSLQDLSAERGIVSVSTKPGSVIIFDCNLMHGSNGNISPYPRVNLFFVFNAKSNQLRAPYCGQPARPEYLAAREMKNIHIV